MNLGTYLKSEIVFLLPGLNSNVCFCVVKIGSIFKEGSLWTPPLRRGVTLSRGVILSRRVTPSRGVILSSGVEVLLSIELSFSVEVLLSVEAYPQ